MEIFLTSFYAKNFVINDFSSPERENTYHKILIKYLIKEEGSSRLIEITIIDTAYIPETLISAESESVTIFSVKDDNYDYLNIPTNSKTISVMCELTGVAISHARVFMLEDGQTNNLGNLVIPHHQLIDLEIIVKECLLTSLN